MNILIIGCGKVGSAFAMKMQENGHDVVVLDENGAALDRLGAGFEGIKMQGVPIDTDVLIQAGIQNCDAVCAVTNDDNVNIMISEIAKNLFHVSTVLTRIADEDKKEVYQKLGLHTVCPTKLTMDALASALDEYVEEQYIACGSHRMKFFTLQLPKHLIGKKAYDIKLEENETLYAILRKNGNISLVMDYSVELQEGDRLIFSKIVD
jgi:trk system potassium uptake protein TrkA